MDRLKRLWEIFLKVVRSYHNRGARVVLYRLVALVEFLIDCCILLAGRSPRVLFRSFARGLTRDFAISLRPSYALDEPLDITGFNKPSVHTMRDNFALATESVAHYRHAARHSLQRSHAKRLARCAEIDTSALHHELCFLIWELASNSNIWPFITIRCDERNLWK
jgi:hypothetical protein